MSLYTAVSLGSSTANSTWNRFIIFTITFPPKPVGLRVFSKNDILPACRKRCAHPLAPSARVTPHSVGRCREATEGPGPEGLRPQAVGERTVRLPEIFRAMARFSPSAPSGHLPRRGRFFDTMRLSPKGKAFRYACSCTYRINASRSAVERTTAVYIQSPMSRRSAWGMRSHIRIREPYLAMICAWVCLYSWQSRRPA